jgi:hypothetical protein
MGIRIHKMIGWGMPAKVFEENVGFEVEDDDFQESLWDKLDSIKELTMPDKWVDKVFADWKGFVAEPDLLAKTFRLDPEKPCTEFLRDASELCQGVSDYDEPVDVHLFLPSGLHYESLYRWDNTLDYVECTHDLSTGKFADDTAAYLLTELKQNPYPWNNDFMDEEGKQVQDTWRTKPGLVPRPPAELRWWLTETGVLREGAWKLLRPYYARWWG